MNLRTANALDAEAIAALHTASWRSAYSSVLSTDYLELSVSAERKAVWKQRLAAPKANQYVVVAEKEAAVVGFGCAFVDEHAEWGSYLDNLHVRSELQGRGLGTALVTNIAQWCELQVPGRGLYLSVNQDNIRAQQFYLRLGARNTKAGVWNAPDGSRVPTYWFVWGSTAPLAASSANPSFQPTAFGGG